MTSLHLEREMAQDSTDTERSLKYYDSQVGTHLEYYRTTMKLPNAAVSSDRSVSRVRMYISFFFYDTGMY